MVGYVEQWRNNMSKEMKGLIILLVVASIGGIIGFFIGRATNKQVEKVVYRNERPIVGNIVLPIPSLETIPINPILPYKFIFIGGQETQVVDTSKIISDYISKKTYDFTLFDNEYGKLDLKPSLQYNSLLEVPYTYTPISKIVYKKDIWDFYTSSSYNTFNIGGVGGGFFYHSMGLEYKYLYQFDTSKVGHEIGFKFKF